MGVKGGPDIETDGLVFHLDAAARNKSYPVDGLDVEYLVVAGGGAGGRHHGGGGGAGGLLYGRTTVSEGTNAVVIGAGGARDSGTNNSPGTPAGNGQNSTAFGLTAIGGGGGGQYNGNGSSGGSGGGPSNWSTSRLGGAGTSGQGFSALNGSTAYNTRGGGGGAGGSPPSSNNYNDGGIGKFFGYTFGISLGEDGWFAGGGAAGTYGGSCGSQYLRFTGRNTGGRGGGAAGGYGCHGNAYAAYDGQANTGGGGGGEPAYNSLGGNGGSGIVIIKYKGAQKATGGDSIVSRKGFTIHIFTSSGNFVVGDRVGGTSRNKVVGGLKNMDSSNFNNTNKGYFTFDGTNEYIDLPTINVNSTANTICTWARKANTDGGFHNIYTPWSNGFDNWLGSYTNKWFLFVTQAANVGNVFIYSNSTIVANTWYFICSTVDSNVAKLYVNGELNFTVSLGFTIGSWNAAATIGRRATISNYYWEGDIASISVYNYGLSAKEILDNYNATKGRFGL